uniref:Putative secreted protein n=1 Tax=Ixodes ricinus TaxID=34613 RepID=A0A6B0U3W2_IXORI
MQRRPISSLFFYVFFSAGARDNYSWTLVLLNAMIQGHLLFRSALVSQKSGFDFFFFFFLLKEGKGRKAAGVI